MLAFNGEELYSEHFEKRGIDYVDQYVTPKMAHPTPSQIKKMNIVHHSWTHGDKYYKLAHEHYGDASKWWVIALYNQKPTESHVSVGDVVFIPYPLDSVLYYMGY